MSIKIYTNNKPFIKWAGGKQQIINDLLTRCPKEYNKYFEPFCGSGALFFALKPDNSILSDVNPELVNSFTQVRDNVEELIKNLEIHKNEPDYFYAIRQLDTSTMNPVDRASRFLYLNRTCFNGLYRENKKGQFNVPFGKYKNPDIIQGIKLREASKALKHTKILLSDYKMGLAKVKKGDFIYLDPPYFPLGGYSDFKRYNKTFFERKDHEELAELFRKLDQKGCFLLLSNSDTEFTRKLYEKWNVKSVMARRMINCDASKRGKISEILVSNY